MSSGGSSDTSPPTTRLCGWWSGELAVWVQSVVRGEVGRQEAADEQGAQEIAFRFPCSSIELHLIAF